MRDSAEDFLAAHDDPRPPTVYCDGDVVADWRVTAFLGRGGSGEVYRVEHCPSIGAMQSPVALKVLANASDTARARFIHEAELLAKMNNPAFPRFIARGETGGRLWIVTELLEPRLLPSADSDVADFLLGLCNGVALLHRMGYVHRDIKPGNILWRGSSPVLVDLGLAKDLTRNFEAEGTSISLVDGHVAGVGTPGYAAPEQMTGDSVSPAADVHALGMLVRECFGGRPPPAWERIVRRAVSSVPDYRYSDVEAFARAVRRRHLRRYVLVSVCVAMLVCAMLPFFNPAEGKREASACEKSEWEALCKETVTNVVVEQTVGILTATNEMFGSPGRFIVMPAGRSFRTLTNRVSATIVNLGGRTNVFACPIRLESGRDYWIVGPGKLDAAIVGPTNCIVHVANCVIENRTDMPWPQSGPRYRLEGGALLCFPNLRRDPDARQRGQVEPFDGFRNEIRYRQ